MPSPESILDLLERWDEQYEQGRDLSPAELAPAAPALWDELARRLARRRHLLGLIASTPSENAIGPLPSAAGGEAHRGGVRGASGDRPRRHGRGVQGCATRAEPRCRPEDDPGRLRRRGRGASPLSHRGGGPRAASAIRTSSASTPSARTRASRISPWSTSRAAAWRSGWRAGPCRRPRPPDSSNRSPAPWPPCTPKASCIATSSRPTCFFPLNPWDL